MDLILWRHADALEGTPDHERELTIKGRTQAKRMAQWLNQHLPEDAVLLVSPAVRAQQTARALKRTIITCGELDTDTDCMAALKAIGQTQAGATVVAVGHQPTLGRIASRLLTGVEGDLSVKKGAAWWITVRRERKSLGVLRAVMTPEML
jgi:phosphohistidine phosphatase